MQCNFICISNDVEYLDEEQSYKNISEEVILWISVILECSQENIAQNVVL